MADSQMNVKGNSTTSTMGQILWRLVTSAVVLAITAFFTPGFSINNLWTLAIAAIVLSIMDYVITKFTGLHASSWSSRFPVRGCSARLGFAARAKS